MVWSYNSTGEQVCSTNKTSYSLTNLEYTRSHGDFYKFWNDIQTTCAVEEVVVSCERSQTNSLEQNVSGTNVWIWSGGSKNSSCSNNSRSTTRTTNGSLTTISNDGSCPTISLWT